MSEYFGIENPGYNLPTLEGMEANFLMSSESYINFKNPSIPDDNIQPPKRDNWGNEIEFLLSCIALSVGLGNVWRFPFIALENGGGAFLIPYIIALFLVGKPIYYLEMIMGQFSSCGTVKAYSCVPIMKGIGYGQVILTFFLGSYYSSLMALTLRYFVDSFYATLPWSYCREEWGSSCMDSKLPENDRTPNVNSSELKKTSAEFYFVNIILHEKANINDGIGVPNWTLVITLAFAWLVIALVIIRGVKSSGKASYFLAIFPYVIMLVLLIRAMTLPGCAEGVLYFLEPQWDKLLDAQVWYAAVTQVFFSLTVCYGVVPMYSSYNRFRHNIRRDCTIVTAMDTCTSLLSGIIIFGILGNLAYESNNSDIKSVVKGGPGLAFISYPDAIAKFKAVPQIFSAIFFMMMFTLGVGSNVGLISTIINVLLDRFVTLKRWAVVVVVVTISYFLGLMYVTPGGQFMLNIIDFYAVTIVATVLGIIQLITMGWIYGVKNLCRDIKFMLDIKTSIYYRICWGLLTPAFMTAILVYMFVDYKPLEYNNVLYPDGLYALGWCISAVAIGQVAVWGAYTIHQGTELSFVERFFSAFRPAANWGPLDPATHKEYQEFVRCNESLSRPKGFWRKCFDNIFG